VSGSIVLDAGAFIAVQRRSPRIQEIVHAARARNVSLVVPTAALAQVVRSGGRQADLRRFLADSYLRFAALDYHAALRIGSLLGEAGVNDVVDAAVVVCARDLGLAPVITSDPADLRKLDPALPLIVI
jgi:hypothetical protein